MKQLYILCVFCLLMVSCNKSKNCKKTLDQHYINGITLKTSTPIFQKDPYTYKLKAIIEFTSVSETIKGEKCDEFYPPIAYTNAHESYLASDIFFYCNKPLTLNNDTIRAYANLMNRKDIYYQGFEDTVNRFIWGFVTIAIDSTNLPKGDYTFYASGTTNRGNNFTDSITIIH